MKQILTFLTLLICLSGFSQTQLEMNEQANNAYKIVDKELNSVYQEILIAQKSDTVFIRNFKVSQRLWIAFRDAELKAKFSNREQGYYGSMLPMCVAIFLEKMTEDRLKDLRKYLDNKEGVCN
jgi:uncharacterized protein YecT (DUF1311 family)